MTSSASDRGYLRKGSRSSWCASLLWIAAAVSPGLCFAADVPPSTPLETPEKAALVETSAAESGSDAQEPETPPTNEVDASDAKPRPDPSTPTDRAEVAPQVQPSAQSDPVIETPGSGLFEQSLAGSGGASVGNASGPAADLHAFELNGYVRGDLFVGKVPGFRQGIVKAGYGELAFKVKVKKERYGDAYAEVRFRYGLQGHERALFADLREAYVNAYLGRLELRLGHQIIAWGRADAFNPTNNLTPFDLRVRSPTEDDRRIGNLGARAFLNFAPGRIEGVWLPLYSPAELPRIELDEFVAFGEPNFPNPELRNGLGALRLHLELPSFEASASYLYGYAPLPGVALRGFTIGQDPPEVTISRTAYNHHVAGLDFSTAFSDVLAIRAEAAYRHPIDYENRVYAPRPDLQYVLGLERSFGAVSVIAQYVGRYVFDWQRAAPPENPIQPAALAGFTPPIPTFLRQEITSSINEELAVRNQALFSQRARIQHLASVRLEWLTLYDTLSVACLGVLNFTTKEWLVYPKLGYRISDGMTTSLGAEIYAGPDDTLFGLIDEELSAAYAELKFSF